MRKALTDRFCRTVKVEEGRQEFVDASPNAWNLTLRVTATTKSWQVRYRIRGKRQRKHLGTFPSTSLKEARAASAEIGGLVQRGVDPKELEAQTRGSEMTLQDLVVEYVAEHCKRHQRSWRETERIFENWVVPTLGDLPLVDVNRGVILELLHDLEKVGLTTQVNRVLSQIKACLTWAVEEREYLPVNPIATLHRKKRRVPEKSRTRILSDRELKAIWNAVEHLSEPSRSFGRPPLSGPT